VPSPHLEILGEAKRHQDYLRAKFVWAL
jgi:hypothetical protein